MVLNQRHFKAFSKSQRNTTEQLKRGDVVNETNRHIQSGSRVVGPQSDGKYAKSNAISPALVGPPLVFYRPLRAAGWGPNRGHAAATGDAEAGTLLKQKQI